MTKNIILQVQWMKIGIIEINWIEYICLTDMIKAKDGDFFVSDWLRNRNTIEFLWIWEEINNTKFNYGEFATIKSNSWLNSYKLSTKDRIKKTQAIGLIAKTWRYGWTYAHKDIAFEFWMRISPRFKIYLIKEFQRLKEQEQKSLGWSVSREIAKINYRIHTDAIKNNLIPKQLSISEINRIYSSEADLLNKILFWETANERKKNNLTKEGNIRDYATIEQLIVLSNLESINALLINNWLSQYKRIQELSKTAISQMRSLIQNQNLENNKKLDS